MRRMLLVVGLFLLTAPAAAGAAERPVAWRPA